MRAPRPIPPQGIRIFYAGTTYELDHTLRYLGVRDGLHRWQAYGPPGIEWNDERIPQIDIKALPGRTELDVPIRPQAGGRYRFVPAPAPGVRQWR